MDLIKRVMKYETTEHKGMIGDQEITVRNSVPIFDNEADKRERKAAIESCLFNIFAKYIEA